MTEVDEKNESSFPSSREPFDEESIVTGARTPVPLSPLSLSQKEAPTNSVYPDGGLQANLTVLGAFVALFCTFGQMNAFGTFQAWYASHQLAGINASTISWIGSLQLWIFFFSGFAVGRLFDEYGPKWLMSVGTVCYFASIMLTSMCVHYYQYVLAQGVLFGLGVGLLFYPSLSSVSTHFSKYRATALGIASAGSSFGGVAYPIMLERLFHQVGFGWGVRISGFVSGAGCVVATILTSSHLRSKATPCPRFAVKAIRDWRFILLAAGGCFVALGLFIPYFYIVDYARNYTRVDHLSLYVLAVMNAGGVLGRIAPAYVSDCIGRFNLLIPAAFFSGLSCIVLWLGAQTITQILVFCALYGFFSGAFISLLNPCVAQISDMQEIGTRIGLLYTFISFPSLVGGPTAGVLLGHHTYNGAIIFSGCTTMCGSLLIVASKLVIDRRILARV